MILPLFGKEGSGTPVFKILVRALTDACLTADPGVTGWISGWSHTFREIDLEIISTIILLRLNHSRRVVVSYMQKCVQEVLVNRLLKLVQEKVWLGELTIPL